jgi:hypothetical protein
VPVVQRRYMHIAFAHDEVVGARGFRVSDTDCNTKGDDLHHDTDEGR